MHTVTPKMDVELTIDVQAAAAAGSTAGTAAAATTPQAAPAAGDSSSPAAVPSDEGGAAAGQQPGPAGQPLTMVQLREEMAHRLALQLQGQYRCCSTHSTLGPERLPPSWASSACQAVQSGRPRHQP